VSRSHWAWWPSGASSAALRLTRRCCLVAAAVAVWALGPASSLVRAADRSPSTTATSIIKNHAPADLHHHSVKGALRHHRPLGQSGAWLLRPGAGYASRDGSRLVRQLQRQLALAGDHPGPLDGRFGPLTEAAVIRCQTAHGLPVDGIVGPLTAGALRAGRRALAPGAGYRTVSGSSAVRVLQRRLARRGFDPGPIDGRYGPLTMRAVAHFQRARHLTMTGIAGVHTRAILVRSTQPRHPTSSPASTPVGLQPSHKQPPHEQPSRTRQQLPLTPAASPTDNTLPVLPITITVLLLGVAMLGWLAVTVSHEVAGHPNHRPDDRADTSSNGLPHFPARVSTPVRVQTGLTQQQHPTSSPASIPAGMQPSNERQQPAPQPSNEPHPDHRPDDRAGTSSNGLPHFPVGVSIPVRVQTGLTQQQHPTSSPASTPVGLQPSNERRRLPLTPAAGPTDSEHEEAITTGRVAVHPSHKSGATPAAGPLAAEPRQNPFGGARRT
jgi:peptidoglycan hydrolase-like protein with peptidoglycan-binding domain